MAGIIDSAIAKKAGSPLNPLDAGDFGDVPKLPDESGLAPAPKPALANVAPGIIDTANDPTSGTGDNTLQPADASANPLDGQMPGAAIPGRAALPGQTDTTGANKLPSGSLLQSTITGSVPGLANNGKPAESSTPPQTGGPLTVTPPSPPSNTGGSTTYDTKQNTSSASNGTAWSPTAGIVDQIQGITPHTVEGQGYTSGGVADTPGATSTGYDATGYTAQQGTAATSGENVSSAVDRIIDKDSPLMQRAAASAAEQANSRGLLNSSMAVGAGQSAVLDKASELASGDVANAQFNAQQQNVMTINNVQQANAAAAFHADATNQAAQFAAAAKNSASQFNSAEAQQKAIVSAQLWDQAAQYSAQAQQAAKMFDAQAYNDAMQRYVDAKNAATAAQNDAVNLSRRDTAQISAGIQQANIGAAATIGAAQAHAGGMIQAAQIGAEASANNLKTSLAAQQQMQTNALSEDMSKYNLGLNQQQQQWAANLSASQFNNFQSGYTAISTSQLEPEAKQNALDNFMQMWTASGTLPFDIKPPGT